jgi:hypothetical protein
MQSSAILLHVSFPEGIRLRAANANQQAPQERQQQRNVTIHETASAPEEFLEPAG